jgi:hypothetical protein
MLYLAPISLVLIYFEVIELKPSLCPAAPTVVTRAKRMVVIGGCFESPDA